MNDDRKYLPNHYMTKLYKNILFAAAALVMPSALADIPESSVPAAAVSSIKGAYPNAGVIEWDSEMHGLKKIYEAEFKINGFQYDVKIAPDGKIVRIKEEMAVSSLPEAVRSSVLKRYPGCRIKEAKKITEGELVRYKVEVEDSRDDYDVLIAPDGNILHVDR